MLRRRFLPSLFIQKLSLRTGSSFSTAVERKQSIAGADVNPTAGRVISQIKEQLVKLTETRLVSYSAIQATKLAGREASVEIDRGGVMNEQTRQADLLPGKMELKTKTENHLGAKISLAPLTLCPM